MLRACISWCREFFFSSVQVAHLPADWSAAGSERVPRILCANHPSSFLDPIIVASFVPFKLAFLARGDAFTPRFNAFLRNYLNMMPVWRRRDGLAQVPRNYETFDLCLQKWRQGGSLIIFSEGLCVQEWKLRTLSKGTARLVLQAAREGIDLEVVPVGINYAHFSGPGKAYELKFGPPVKASVLWQQWLPAGQVPADLEEAESARFLVRFNRWLQAEMEPLVLSEAAILEASRKTKVRKAMLWLSRFLHAPYYMPLRHLVGRACRDTVHFDSVLFAVLMFTYPLYLGLIGGALTLWQGTEALPLVSVWPLAAYWSRRGT